MERNRESDHVVIINRDNAIHVVIINRDNAIHVDINRKIPM